MLISRTAARAGSDGRRRAVASYRTYREAERAVDFLADSGFPVERLVIVGDGLKNVERVIGRFGYGEAGLQGGMVGGIVGLVLGWLFGALTWFDSAVAAGWLAIEGLVAGFLIGTAAGLVGHALTRGRRDFASVSELQAERYEVLADAEVADEAAERLGGLREEPSQAPRVQPPAPAVRPSP